MYDLAKRVGRYGFEVQTQLLVDPHQLVFDNAAKKLGTEFSSGALQSSPALPPGWRWTADPTSRSKYPELTPPHAQAYFFSEHPQYADAVGYQNYWVYQECEQIAYQLEVVSEPFDDGYTERNLGEDGRRIFGEGLAALVDAGIVTAFDPAKRQSINEQISIELDDTRWSKRVDPLLKLAWLGCGIYLLTRLRGLLEPPDAYVEDLLSVLDEHIVTQARTLQNYDLFRNYRLLLDGYFFGTEKRLDLAGLRRLLGSRIHAAILCADYDNDTSYALVHGAVDLQPEELAPLRPDDFARLRHFGIDSRFLELLIGDEPQCLDPRRGQRHEMLRRGIARIWPLQAMQTQLRAAMRGEPCSETISVPLCHPRKSMTPGCVYLEWRAVRRLRIALPERYRTRFLSVPTDGGPLEVIFIDHLHRMARDLSTLMDVAIIAGSELAEAVASGAHGFAERDFDRLAKRFAPRLDYLLRTYQRPPWTSAGALR
ncbi:MAG: hypothetical protein ACE37F_00510 [Nannocystaceae bacterium]|nr:hypothetical protein [bacterium]